MRWLARLAQEIKPPQIHPLWILNPGTPPKITLNLPTMAAEVIILSDMIHSVQLSSEHPDLLLEGEGSECIIF